MTITDIRAFALQLLPSGTHVEAATDGVGRVRLTVIRPAGHSDVYWHYRFRRVQAEMDEHLPLCLEIEWLEIYQ